VSEQTTPTARQAAIDKLTELNQMPLQPPELVPATAQVYALLHVGDALNRLAKAVEDHTSRGYLS
jgi:hypothetical protein